MADLSVHEHVAAWNRVHSDRRERVALDERRAKQGAVERAVLAIVTAHQDGLRTAEILRHVPRPELQVRKILGRLVKNGILVRVDRGLYRMAGSGSPE